MRAKMTALSARPTDLIHRLRAFWNDLVSARQEEIPEIFPVKLREPLLTATETRFYQVLHAVAGKRVVVCPKMRLADLFRAQSAHPNSKPYANFYKQIASRSVDFVLCERYTLQPLLAIELYDHSLPRGERKKRDVFMDKVFKAGKLPILHLVAQEDYNTRSLAHRIAPYLTRVVYSRGAEPINFSVPPRCPCCHTPMVRRTIISGDYKGREYYACRNYPDCCERMPVTKAMAHVN
jgi:hypothetical protein